MKTYLIEFNKYTYDQYDAFVVVAENEEEAIKMIEEKYPHETFEQVDWEGGYTIEEVLPLKGIILESFNAG